MPLLWPGSRGKRPVGGNPAIFFTANFLHKALFDLAAPSLNDEAVFC
jgi:hypothetical protein